MFTEYKEHAIVAVRLIQMLCVGLTITGIVWSATDLMMIHVLVSVPVSPLSLLFILYGTFGSFLTEALARWMARGSSEPPKN